MACVTGWIVTVGILSAQESVPRPPSASEPGSDPPGRVGRLTALQGGVSFRPAVDTTWSLAEPNQPVTTGDRIWSDTSGQAEVEVGAASVRVWRETEVDVVRLDDRTTQIAVPQGSAILRLSAFSAGDVAEIDAPNAAVTADAIGEYRIDVSADGLTTTVTVWSGSAEVTSQGSSFALAAHQVATIRGDSTSTPTYDVSEATAADDFDQWATQRDQRANRATTDRRYVPSDMPGTDDLDESGSWDNDNDYGPVWYPTHVEADWAPYHAGHWVWFGAWGWTWVDDAPWGWAPFHYGRWAWIHERWGWCPGRVIAPAVFAPALVVFVGGSSWAPVSGFGPGSGIGWFPLAPGEVYRPPYAASTPYIVRANITNVTNITTITNVTNLTNINTITYRNREVANAVTVVPRTVFETASPVQRAAVRIPADEIRRAPLIGAGPTVVPTRASIVGHTVDHPVATPRPIERQRAVVALHAPPPASPGFTRQLQAITANGGRPPTQQQLTALRVTPTSPATQAAVRILPVRSAARPASSGGQLTPARAGLPAVHPAIQNGTVAHAVARPPGALAVPPAASREPVQPAAPQATRPPEQPAAPPSPAPPVLARPTPPSGRPATVGPPPPVPQPAVRAGSPSLTASYGAQRQTLEARHIQEFATPPAAQSPAALAQRQETEDRGLESRYHQAAVAGRTTMPPTPPPPPSRPAAPARRAPTPSPTPPPTAPRPAVVPPKR